MVDGSNVAVVYYDYLGIGYVEKIFLPYLVETHKPGMWAQCKAIAGRPIKAAIYAAGPDPAELAADGAGDGDVEGLAVRRQSRGARRATRSRVSLSSYEQPARSVRITGHRLAVLKFRHWHVVRKCRHWYSVFK
jgi:hypothetical protein